MTKEDMLIRRSRQLLQSNLLLFHRVGIFHKSISIHNCPAQTKLHSDWMTTGWKKFTELNSMRKLKKERMTWTVVSKIIYTNKYHPSECHPEEESNDKELWDKAREGCRSDNSSAKIQSSACCWFWFCTNWWSRWSNELIDDGESISVTTLRFGENVSHPWWKSDTVVSLENLTNKAIVRISAALNRTEDKRRWTATCWNSWNEISSRSRRFTNSISLMKLRRWS